VRLVHAILSRYRQFHRVALQINFSEIQFYKQSNLVAYHYSETHALL